MDNETAEPVTARPTLPRSAAFEPATMSETPPREASGSQALVESEAGEVDEKQRDRTGVFRHLVREDGDIAGLVAYSIYKQHKLDWLGAFEAAKGRAPDASELSSYIIGEGTPRRLATYRHLAEATLSGHGPDLDPSAAGGRPMFARRGGFSDKGTITAGLIATYALIALLLLIGLWLAAHFTMSSR